MAKKPSLTSVTWPEKLLILMRQSVEVGASTSHS
jgi:hypothetical protein